jgi:hypothetical protein
MKHRIANDAEMPDGRGAVTESPSLSSWSGR